MSPHPKDGIISFRSSQSANTILLRSRRESILIASRPSIQVIVRTDNNLIKKTWLTPSLVFSCLILGSGNSDLILKTIDWCFNYAEQGELPMLPLDMGNQSDFSVSVLNILSIIPRGETYSYGKVARLLGNVDKSRAVGQACGDNPFPLLIPCHRVIGQKDVGGFSQNIEIKKTLLHFENTRLFF